MARIRTSHVLCAWVLIGLLFQPAARAQEEKLGDVNFPISCSASAQTQFNRAVAMLHSFFFPETMKAFTAITRQEPSCAMAYWGVAISQRPNPLVAPFPAELMRNGWEAIEAGRAAGAKTQREKDWIEALAVFFKDYDKIDLRTRTLAYEAAMARLTTNYPDDNEAAIFYALALTRRWTSATRLTPTSSRRPPSCKPSKQSCPTIRAYRTTSSTVTTSQPFASRVCPPRGATRTSRRPRRMRFTCPRIPSRCWECGRIPSRQT